MTEKEIFEKLFNIVLKYKEDKKTNDVVNYKDIEDLKQILDLNSKSASNNWEDIFYWIDLYLKYSVNTSNPYFLNRMWSDSSTASQIWDIITSISNTCSSTYESAPVATLMENYIINTMLDLVGFKNGEWQMTTWSSNANMIAMMIARNKSWESIKKKWLYGSKKLVWFSSEDSHYSIDKASNILWIWEENIIKIPVTKTGEMDINILEEKIIENKVKWNINFIVIATAWTTVRWAYDNIEKILILKEKYNFWLHVDWAWGWPVFLNDNLKNKFLKSIELVDSFTFDFHKMPWMSLICNILLINNSGLNSHLLKNCSSWDTNYIFKTIWNDLWQASLQCWKRVDILKLFLEWKYSWKQWISDKIDYYYNLCKYAETYINNNPKLELVSPRISFNICFRYISKNQDLNILNKQIRQNINNWWKIMVWSANIKNIYVIRIVFANFNTKDNHIKSFFDEVISIWNSLI